MTFKCIKQQQQQQQRDNTMSYEKQQAKLNRVRKSK